MIRLMRPPARTSSSSTSFFSANSATVSPFFIERAVVRVDVDHVAHLEPGDVDLDRQRAGVFLRVEEDRRDLAAEADAAEALVGHERDVLAGVPRSRCWWRSCGRAGADHVADVGDQVALRLEVLDELRSGRACRLLRARCRGARSSASPAQCSGMSGRLQASGAGDRSSVLVSPVTLNTVTVIFCGTSGRLVNHSASAQLCTTACGVRVAGLGLLGHVVEVVEHQQRLLQPVGGDAARPPRRRAGRSAA